MGGGGVGPQCTSASQLIRADSRGRAGSSRLFVRGPLAIVHSRKGATLVSYGLHAKHNCTEEGVIMSSRSLAIVMVKRKTFRDTRCDAGGTQILTSLIPLHCPPRCEYAAGGLVPLVSSDAARSAVLALERWQSSGQCTQS